MLNIFEWFTFVVSNCNMKDQKDILKRIRNSDIQAFEELFNAYYSLLCSFAASFVRNQQIAEEIVDDLFYHIWEIRRKFEIRDSMKSYLLRSTYNRCISWLRQQKKDQKLIGDIAVINENAVLHIPSMEASPLHVLMNNEFQRKVETVIDELPHQCKQIFLLSRNEELSYTEIAERLQISKNTVKTQIKIALEKLRRGLDL